MNEFYIDGQLSLDLFEKFYRENPYPDTYTPEQKKAYDDYIAICDMHKNDLDFIARHPVADMVLKSVLAGGLTAGALNLPKHLILGKITTANIDKLNQIETGKLDIPVEDKDTFINNIKEFLKNNVGNEYTQMFYDFIGKHPYITTGGVVAIAAFGSWLIYKGFFTLYRKWKEFCAERNLPITQN